MDVPLQGLRWAIAPCLDDGKPIPSFWANDRHPSLSCPGISRHLEVRCHHGVEGGAVDFGRFLEDGGGGGGRDVGGLEGFERRDEECV